MGPYLANYIARRAIEAYPQYAKQFIAGRRMLRELGPKSSMVKRRTDTKSATRGGTSTKFSSASNSRSSTKVSYKKRKRTKRARIAGKRNRKFSKKVQKALQGPMPMSVLIEQQGIASPLSINNKDDNHGDTASASSLSDGFQLHCGFSHAWGVNTGPLFTDGTAGTVENYEIAEQSARMGRTIIGSSNAATAIEYDNLVPYNDGTIHNEKFFIKQKILKMTVHNNSTPTPAGTAAADAIVAKDLIFDLYEFVAAQDIKDVAFKTPANAWASYAASGTQAMASSSVTGGTTNLLDYYKGLTPLDFAGFGQWWKLLKKQRCIIPYNETEGTDPYQTFTLHGKRYVHDPDKWRNLYAKKGITKFWVMVISPDQTDNTYTTPTSGAASDVCNLYFQRITHYKPIVASGTSKPNPPPNSTRLIIAPTI